MQHLHTLNACIRESVDSLCRDGTDAPIIFIASKLSNAKILRLLRSFWSGLLPGKHHRVANNPVCFMYTNSAKPRFRHHHLLKKTIYNVSRP